MNEHRDERHRAVRSPQSVAVIQTFAAALDRSDFDGTRALLAPDVTCDDGRDTWRGPEAVVAAYARAAAWAERRFDDVRHESTVAADDDGGFVVEFTDYLLKVPGRWHRHRREQRLWLDADGRVARIVHRELPGEAESLRAYLEAVGITE